MTIVERVEERLSEVSPSKAARILGVHANTVNLWKSGATEPRLSLGLKLAKWLELDPVHLAMFFEAKKKGQRFTERRSER